MAPTVRNIANFAAFQCGWFAAVLGVARGLPWLGLVVVPIGLLFVLVVSSDWRAELRIAVGAALLGFVFDTAVSAAGWFEPVPFVWGPPLSPPWMVALWVNQATTLNLCLGWLRGRYALGSLLGAAGGPLAYLAGAKLGAAVIPSAANLWMLALAWAAAFPLLQGWAAWNTVATNTAVSRLGGSEVAREGGPRRHDSATTSILPRRRALFRTDNHADHAVLA